MKTTILFFGLAFLVVTNSFAQTHNTSCMRCKYSKNYIGNNKKDGNQGRALDECGCTACFEIDRKEKMAKQAEQKRRDAAIAAKINAEREAKQKAFEAEQQRKRDEAKKKAIDEANAKKRAAELKEKYAAIATKNKVQMANQQLENNVDFIEDVKDFSDDKERVYGLKFQDSIVVRIPFTDDTKYVWTNRLGKSNYFLIRPHDQKGKIRNAHILDIFGKKVKIEDDENIYERAYADEEKNSIVVYKIISGFSTIGDRLVGGPSVSTEMNFVASMEGVNAHYNKKLNGDFRGLGFGYDVYYANATGYLLDFNMQIKEKKTGILIQHAGYGEPTY